MTQQPPPLIYRIYRRSMSAIGSAIERPLFWLCTIGGIIGVLGSPFVVFFAIKTGCVPEENDLIIGWTQAACRPIDYFPQMHFWGNIWPYLFFTATLILILSLIIITRQIKKRTPTLSTTPTADEILTSLHRVVSKDPDDKGHT